MTAACVTLWRPRESDGNRPVSLRARFLLNRVHAGLSVPVRDRMTPCPGIPARIDAVGTGTRFDWDGHYYASSTCGAAQAWGYVDGSVADGGGRDGG